jgi:hypothetical protein
MIEHSDRIRLFNWVQARANILKAALDESYKNPNSSMEHFAEELQAQGKALALLELAVAILDIGWHAHLSEYSDELTIPEQQSSETDPI